MNCCPGLQKEEVCWKWSGGRGTGTIGGICTPEHLCSTWEWVSMVQGSEPGQQEQRIPGVAAVLAGARLRLLPACRGTWGGSAQGPGCRCLSLVEVLQPPVRAGCLPARRVMALSVQRSDIFIANSRGNAAGMADFFNHAITQLFPWL